MKKSIINFKFMLEYVLCIYINFKIIYRDYNRFIYNVNVRYMRINNIYKDVKDI